MSGMTPRDRILAAFAHEEPDVVPFDIGGTKVTSLNINAYKNLERCLGWTESPTQWGNYLSQRVHMTEEMSLFFGGDVRRVHVPHVVPLSEDKLKPVQLDEWGIEWTQEPAGLFYVTRPPLAGAQSVSDLDRFKWPEPEQIFYPPEKVAAAARQLRQSTGCAICLDLPDAVVHVTQNIRGYEQWLVDSALGEPFFERMLDHVADIYCAMVAPVLQSVRNDIDMVVVCDDIAVQNGPLMSPRSYRKLIKPRHARIFETIKANTNAKLLFHSCGSTRWALPDLIDIGIDGLNPVQCSAVDMDPMELKRELVGTSYFGGLSIHSMRCLLAYVRKCAMKCAARSTHFPMEAASSSARCISSSKMCRPGMFWQWPKRLISMGDGRMGSSLPSNVGTRHEKYDM